MIGLVFNVQRYSIHDGPGIRTTIFLKGCPLRCQWCHNPEAMSGRTEFGFFPDRCIGCLECIAACPNGVHAVEDGKRVIRREVCRGEGKCAEVCYAEAIERIGYQITVEDALAQAERDRPFYETSRGGVTVSGGEPLRQLEFTVAVLAGARARGLHTALDTCGYAPWTSLAAAAEHADLVLYDVKHMDSAAHRELTGVPNELILENLSRLIELRGAERVWVRYPFIPDLNDGRENVEALAAFLGPLSGRNARARIRVDILPYHQLGQSKYRKLDLDYPLVGQRAPERVEMEAVAAILAAAGLEPHVGG